MLKIHTNGGTTHRVDLDDEEQARQWLEKLQEPAFQSAITGLTLAHRGVQYSLPLPRGFSRSHLHAELIQPDPDKKIKGGERIVCAADDIRVSIMVHRAQRAARVAVLKTGKQRYNPMANIQKTGRTDDD